MGAQLRVEASASDRAIPALLDLSTIGAAPISVGPAFIRKEHWTFAVWQVCERGDHARGQRSIAAFACFGAVRPKDRPPPGQIHVAPVEMTASAIRAPVPIRNATSGLRCG